MHIAIVCRGLGSGGSVAAVALRQALELTRHARVTMVSDTLPERAPGVDLVRVHVRDLAMLRRFRHVPDEYLFARAALRALRSFPSLDFVLGHSHVVAYLAMRPLGVPFGFFVHGDINDRPKGTYDARLTAFYRWVTPRAYGAANVVFVLAAAFVPFAQAGGSRHVEVVPNGIDPADIGLTPDAPRDRLGRPLQILYVGRLAVEKGISVLLDAFDLVGPSCELTIAGTGPLELASRGRSIERVHYLGPVPRLELGVLYSSHDVFCTATLSEPFGVVILEALVSGLPVIGTSVGGIPELVEHGRNGLIVAPADASALADAIRKIERDEPLRKAMAAAARGSVLPRFSWTGIGDRIAGVIRTIISR